MSIPGIALHLLSSPPTFLPTRLDELLSDPGFVNYYASDRVSQTYEPGFRICKTAEIHTCKKAFFFLQGNEATDAIFNVYFARRKDERTESKVPLRQLSACFLFTLGGS